MTVTTFADRLNELIYHYRLNKNSLSVKLGFSANTSITRLANHPDRNPSFDIIQMLLESFPEISGRWLILGEGKMLKKEEIESKTLHTSYYKQEAGVESPFLTESQPTDRMRIFGYNDCDLAIDVFSDSMAPKINTGDIVICKSQNLNDPITYGEAYLIFTNEPIIRYIKSSPEPGVIKVSAENQRFEDTIITLSEITSLYRVKGIIRRIAV